MYIKVKVSVGSKNEKIEKISNNNFRVWVKEKAERNMANKKVCEIIAKELKVSIKSIRIIKGHHLPSKIVSVLV